MEQEKINRINELAKKAKTDERLTPDELVERDALRKEYLAGIRKNFRAQLENIDIEYPDGEVVPVKQKDKK